MNYIKELNAFYDWLETNSLSTSAIALWHALMHINNKAGWAEEFGVAASVLCIKTGLADRTIRSARNELKQKGRIEWNTRRGNQSAIYKMIPLIDNLPAISAGNKCQQDDNNPLSVINADKYAGNHADKCTDSSAGNHATLNKLNKTKRNDIYSTSTGSEDERFVSDKEFSELAKLYQQVIGQPNAFTAQWISDVKAAYGFEWVKNAMLEAESRGKRSKKYTEGILENWKSNGGMKLSSDKADINKKRTKFHNFEQRSDNYTNDQLEEIMERKRQEAIERMKGEKSI